MLRVRAVCAAVILTACADDPCARLADYICTCHAGDTGFDCEELRRATERADPAVQNACVLELAEQRQRDEEAGLVCDV